MKYKIKVIETLSRIIEVEADSENTAFDKIKDMHMNEDLILSADDFEGVEFYPYGNQDK